MLSDTVKITVGQGRNPVGLQMGLIHGSKGRTQVQQHRSRCWTIVPILVSVERYGWSLQHDSNIGTIFPGFFYLKKKRHRLLC